MKNDFVFIAVLVVTGMLLTAAVIMTPNDPIKLQQEVIDVKQEAINRGFAFYHPTSAVFTWKTNLANQ